MLGWEPASRSRKASQNLSPNAWHIAGFLCVTSQTQMNFFPTSLCVDSDETLDVTAELEYLSCEQIFDQDKCFRIAPQIQCGSYLRKRCLGHTTKQTSFVISPSSPGCSCDLELTYSPVSHFLMMRHQAGFIGHPYLFLST